MSVSEPVRKKFHSQLFTDRMVSYKIHFAFYFISEAIYFCLLDRQPIYFCLLDRQLSFFTWQNMQSHDYLNTYFIL